MTTYYSILIRAETGTYADELDEALALHPAGRKLNSAKGKTRQSALKESPENDEDFQGRADGV